MKKENEVYRTILVVDDVEETRDGIEKLLQVDGYLVESARHEQDAIERARRKHTDLILVSLGGTQHDVLATALHIRNHAELEEDVPVVIFCSKDVEEGDEVDIGQNVYLTHPDNFNQLRKLLNRLLERSPVLLKDSIP